MDNCQRICLWSGPRNISTALMYSFAQRPDTQVVDEPLYAHYLSKTPAKSYHPGAKEVLETMEHDGNKVYANILGPQNKEVLFVKQMTHHFIELDFNLLKQTKNIILTRDPVDMLPSFAKEIENPKMKDVGYALHLELIEWIKKFGQEPIVLDSKKVLDNPKEVLQKLCDRLEIPFTKAMLSWPAGARPEDGCWAKYWYKSVHQSTGFMKYKAKTEAFPEHLKELLEEAKPMYEQISKLAIQ